MRTISAAQISDTVAELCIRANRELPPDVEKAMKDAADREPWPIAADTLGILCRNMDLAREKCLPVCQDTGLACVFAEIGQDVRIEGDFEAAVNLGVSRGYTEGYLRKSVVGDPLRRENTGDNTPAAITVRLVPGDRLKLIVAPKGFGSENMSRLAMLKPADGLEGVKRFIVETVRLAGSNPCPPVIVGVGIGGTMEAAALLAKRQLLRPLGRPSADPALARIEREALAQINASGIGPMGLGGVTTALAVHAAETPTHIAGLPVAVNMQCHACRHAERRL